jgi:hypothetical protein
MTVYQAHQQNLYGKASLFEQCHVKCHVEPSEGRRDCNEKAIHKK